MSGDELEYTQSVKDDLEDFFSSPNKENLPQFLRADKEYDYLDFKSEWFEKSKLSRDIIALANSGGGAIIFGVEEAENGSLQSCGVSNPQDEADFGNQVEKYLPDSVHNIYSLETFDYGDVYDDEISGLTFQVVFVEGAGERAPIVATNAGSSITEGDIYIRRSTKSTTANYEEIQELLQKRRESSVEKETAELHEELRQLKTLYSEIDKNKTYMSGLSGLGNLFSKMYDTKPNPNYPDEDYEAFISNLIEKKKIKIEQRLGVSEISI